VAVAAFCLAAVALGRGRPRVALLVLVLVGLTSVSSQALKALLAYPRYGAGIAGAHIYPAAFPSGHATASMSLALVAVLVASARWRPLAAAVGAIGTLAVTFTLLVDSWHFPSDVLGGYLVAGTWTAVAVAILWRLEGERAQPARRARAPLAQAVRPLLAVAIGILAVAALVALARPETVTTYAREHTVFVGGAGVIGLSALLLAALMSAALRPATSGTPPETRAAPRPGLPRGRG
jgi:hypothetical protein